ncbi:taurine hydroxylase-like protein SAT17 [Colletotrichum liriopes]|uniref:Taurine hydroxylase-like protein SAT17 n=1 Tax=Colletotrichum liriopes TaxID=708192 RepID=A0AA37LLS2_9PEZI|nr:taurine hydroxylase-like protein SAT17 [Colletotrichum liriopes]
MTATCVSYNPSDIDTQRFWDLDVARNKASLEVPFGFPAKLNSPLAWTGADIESNQSEWRLVLTSEEVAAIDVALKKFEAKYQDLSEITAATFELPVEFSQRLRKLSDHLYNGVGFQIIHGLDPSKYDAKQKITVYAGVSAHVCPQRGFIDVVAKGVVGKPSFDALQTVRR